MAGIVCVYQDHYPWDVRVEKFARAMTEGGHAVTIVSRNRTGEPTCADMDGYAIRRLPAGWGPISRTLLNFPAFFSPWWIHAIVKAVRDTDARLIVIRDLPLTPAAWLAGKLTRVPVLMDMAEDYPAMLKSGWDYDGRQSIDVLIRNPRLFAALESWIVPKLDGIAVVSEASGARVRQLLDGAPVPVNVIGNTPRLDLHDEPAQSELAEAVAALPGFKLLYVGFVTLARGISVVIEAVKQVRSRGFDVSLIVVGDGIGLATLEDEARAAGLADQILFPGWLEQTFVPGVIAVADACIVPHFVDPHVETTLPNKIYDYMLQGKPVLVTHSKALREIVEENNCGLFYHDTKAAELADAIIALQDAQLRDSLGANGRTAVTERLNWAQDAKRLNVFVDELIAAG